MLHVTSCIGYLLPSDIITVRRSHSKSTKNLLDTIFFDNFDGGLKFVDHPV